LAALLPTAKRERPEREIIVLLFSSVIYFSHPLCSVLLFLSAGGGGSDGDCRRWLGNQVAAAVMVVLRRFCRWWLGGTVEALVEVQQWLFSSLFCLALSLSFPPSLPFFFCFARAPLLSNKLLPPVFCSPVALASAAPSSVSNDGGAAVVDGAAGWWPKATVEREEQLLGTENDDFFLTLDPKISPCFCFVPSLFLFFFSSIWPLFSIPFSLLSSCFPLCQCPSLLLQNFTPRFVPLFLKKNRPPCFLYSPLYL